MSTYKIKTRNGLLGDFATEYWTEEDHANWKASVERMKKDGTYMEPVTYDITLIDNLALDSNNYTKSTILSSSRFDILDFSNNDN